MHDMGILKQRYEKFVAANNMSKGDPTSFEAFAKHMQKQKTFEKPPLHEEEAFRIYNDYRTARHKLRNESEINEYAVKRYYAYYNNKNFKKVLGRKSMSFLKTSAVGFKHENLFIVARWQDFDKFGHFVVAHLALQEFEIKGRTYYNLTGFCERGKKTAVLFTPHFFERYAERSNLQARDVRQAAILFLGNEYHTMEQFVVGVYPNEACYFSLRQGMCLGHRIKNLHVFKTFVDVDHLGNNQILANLVAQHGAIKQRQLERIPSFFYKGS